jgi:hypothetical protein
LRTINLLKYFVGIASIEADDVIAQGFVIPVTLIAMSIIAAVEAVPR